MTFFSFSSAFDILVVLLVVLDLKFKLWAFVLLIYSSRQRLRNEVVSSLVLCEMSHWCAMVWIRIHEVLVVLPLSLFRVEHHVCLFQGVCRGWRPGMIKHRSGTLLLDDREVGWWCVRSVPHTRRWGARVSWFGLKTKVDGLSVVWHQNH
jgi:hypothetical protein